MIKLVVSDIDGTLIDETEVLGSDALEVAEILRSKNIFFSLATGRVESMTKAYVDELKIDIPYIVTNGATIVHGEKVLQRYQIPLFSLQEIIKLADDWGMSVIYSIDGIETVYRNTPWIISQQKEFDRFHTQHQFTQTEWETLKIDKLSIMDLESGNEQRIAHVEQMSMKLPQDYGFTRYVDRSVEIVHAKANKANGVRKVAESLGLDLKEVLVIGDHQNDLEMIQTAGVGVAVNNAIPALKKAADYVCENEHAAGILEAIKKFC